MVKQIPRSETQIQKTQKISNVTNTSAMTPVYMASGHNGYENFYTVDIQPSVPSNAFANSKELLFDLETSDVPEIKDLYFRFTVSCENAPIKLRPIPYIIRRVIVDAQSGLGDEIARIEPLNIVLWEYMTKTVEQRDQNQFMCGIEYKNKGKKQIIKAPESNYMIAGDTRDFYLPIPVSFLKLSSIDMRFNKTIRFRIELTNDCLETGSVNNCVLDNVALMIKSFNPNNQDEISNQKARTTLNYEYTYLDCEKQTFSDKNLNSNTEVKFELDQFKGRSPFIVVVIKGNSNPSGEDNYKFREIGETGSITITSSSGQDLLNNGRPCSEAQYYQTWTEELDAPNLKGCYIINFSENINKSLIGAPCGFREFDNQKDYLEIKFGDSGRSEVHTLTSTNGSNDSGSFKLACGSNIGLQELAYDSLDVDIEAEIKSVCDCEYDVDISGSVDDGTIVTTFNHKDGRVKNDTGILNIASHDISLGVTRDRYTCSQTTPGKVGWDSGNDYQTEIYFYHFKNVHIAKNGTISCFKM